MRLTLLLLCFSTLTLSNLNAEPYGEMYRAEVISASHQLDTLPEYIRDQLGECPFESQAFLEGGLDMAVTLGVAGYTRCIYCGWWHDDGETCCNPTCPLKGVKF